MVCSRLHPGKVGGAVAHNAVFQSHGFQQRKRLACTLYKCLFVFPLLPLALRCGIRGNPAANTALRVLALQSDCANGNIKNRSAAGRNHAQSAAVNTASMRF